MIFPMKIMIGSDHHGVQVRVDLSGLLRRLGHDVTDVGPSPDNVRPVDYPDIAEKVAGAVSRGEADRGILICGTGIGMSIAANKHKGIRAGLCCDPDSASLTRQHNNANVLCMGARILSFETVIKITDAFLSAEFLGGRHQRRVDMLEA